MENPTIIYILGAGNSGSTILSMALGGHQDVYSLGELVALDRWYADGLLCSCGSKLEDCERWSRFVGVNNRGNLAPVAPFPKIKKLESFGSICAKDCKFADTVGRNCAILTELSDMLEGKVFVDSSKNPLHFYYLRKSGCFRIVPVLVVRKGEQYLDSAFRRGIPFRKAFPRWISKNVLSLKVIREVGLRKSCLKIRYDDLISDPGESLKKICDKAGIRYTKSMLKFYEEEQHNLAGTRTRFTPKPIGSSGNQFTKLNLKYSTFFVLFGGKVWNKIFGA